MIKDYLIRKGFFTINTSLIMLALLLIIFLVIEAMPFIQGYAILDFISGLKWSPDSLEFGIFPMILSSLLITTISIVLAAPLSVSCGIYLEEIASNNVREVFKPIIQTLAGIPSVIYGFFGLTVVVPFIRNTFGGTGFSIITASIILAVMILPTIITVTQDAIKSVPDYYKKASLALGSTHWQVIKNIILPQASLGIFTAIILGIGRAVGETLAVLMVIGNVSIITTSLLSPARTLTSNIALEMGYATGIHYNALFMTALILVIIIALLMIVSTLTQYKLRRC